MNTYMYTVFAVRERSLGDSHMPPPGLPAVRGKFLGVPMSSVRGK